MQNPLNPSPVVAPELYGLTLEEYERLLKILGRAPNEVELAVVGALWSEHCSYKSSKVWLKELIFPHPDVLQGPGENAGIVRFRPPYALAFKIESHNHPSFIEPYQGSATGVGGILRDILAMGARPIALANSLRFGDPNHPLTPGFLRGVVRGVGDYGNCVGVPTLCGETGFDEGYNQNILVNALAVGILREDEVVYARAKKPGSYLVLLGNRTGRDGIQGAVMASQAFGVEVKKERPKVQIADPFVEKLIIEAYLEMRDRGYLEGGQDLGAAGLTSAGFEIASKGGVGISFELDSVPLRESGMTPLEILLSESQERMLLVVPPHAWEDVQRIAERWELTVARVGVTTSTGRFQAFHRGKLWVDLPVQELLEGTPRYTRPHHLRKRAPFLPPTSHPPLDVALVKLIGHPHLASKRWVYEQYDSTVQGNTVVGPGNDSGVAWIPEAQCAFALTLEGNARYVEVDPFLGAQHLVAEGIRNLSCVGAVPLAVTDCLNFGNPEHPEVMEDFIQVIRGLRSALEFLRIPVVSGNVSFYNETEGKDIPPTPILGFLGRVEIPLPHIPRGAKGSSGIRLYLLGNTLPLALPGSAYADIILRSRGGELPPPHLGELEKLRKVLFSAMTLGILKICHDPAEGGILLALAEIAFSEKIGIKLSPDLRDRPLEFWFGEGAQLFLLGVEQEKEKDLIALAEKEGVPLLWIGESGGSDLVLPGVFSLPIKFLQELYEGALPGLAEKGGWR
jgi:phosphoribosylformylglycinamidine synthase